jgi:hypothetical protein
MIPFSRRMLSSRKTVLLEGSSITLYLGNSNADQHLADLGTGFIINNGGGGSQSSLVVDPQNKKVK